MTGTVQEVAGLRCLVLDDEGPPLTLADGGRDLVEAAMNESARLIAVSAGRLDPAFFQLRSGIAGEALQKFVNYNLKFAIVGDVSAHVAASDALRDFVVECNRGREVFFVANTAELESRLAAPEPSR